MSYYTCRVKVAEDTPKGVKWHTEVYLVDAVSVTDAEKTIVSDFKGAGLDFEVKSVSKSNIAKVINPCCVSNA